MSTLEANLLRAQRHSQETSEKLDSLREKIIKFEADKKKSKSKEQVTHTKLGVLKAKIDFLKQERDEFESRCIAASTKLKRLEDLETDRSLLDRIDKMRDVRNTEENNDWLRVSQKIVLS